MQDHSFTSLEIDKMSANTSIEEYHQYESDSDDYRPNGFQQKRRKLSEVDRLKRCRERNRVHARNTRERKRVQMDALQRRIQELLDEKCQLKRALPDTSVASILMSLSIPDNQDRKNENYSNIESFIENGTGVEDASVTMDRVRAQVSALLSDDEELEMDKTLLQVDRSSCTTSQLEMIRRERNRMHAKKTRLRKKRMLAEMETIISRLEQENWNLRQDLLNNKTKSLNASENGSTSGNSSTVSSYSFDRAQPSSGIEFDYTVGSQFRVNKKIEPMDIMMPLTYTEHSSQNRTEF